MKKYELIETDFKILLGVKVFRIRALRQINRYNINVGDLGGYIEKESNLDQESTSWVGGDAIVYGNVRVSGNVRVYGNAQVYGDAYVYGNAQVSDNVRVSDNAQVYGNAQVSGNVRVSGDAQVSGDAKINKLHEVKNVTNLKYNLTSLPKGIQVGCHFRTLKEWKEQHVKLGVENGMSPELSKEYYRLMVALRRVQKQEAKESQTCLK